MAPLRLCLCLCLPLLLPPPAAPAPAPLSPRTDWAACRSLSRDLARLLAAVPEPHSALLGVPRILMEAPGGPKSSRGEGPGGSVGGSRIPASPPRSPQRCLHRILQALQHYRDLLGSDIFREQPQPQLETTMEQLLHLVQQEHGHPLRHPMAPSEAWTHQFQRHLALKRLRSFAAVMSRVFNHSAR
ncbi:IL23A protein, partial [Climacteris rufus]|nr:IL23A protein [Climacteris rufus]